MEQKYGKVWFVGAGPGDPELITVKASKILARAGAVLYAGSLVNVAATQYAGKDCEIADSKGMNLGQINEWLISRARQHKNVVRLQTGDPSLYGALIEMARELRKNEISWQVVPGISSAMASVAAAGESLTIPEVSQTVIFTRIAGRTPMPEGEDLKSLAMHKCSLCIFLSITLITKVMQELIAANWSENAPVLVVQKASWVGEEKIIRGTIDDIVEKCKVEKVTSQAMIVVSPTLGAIDMKNLPNSKLYDASFSHRYRKGER